MKCRVAGKVKLVTCQIRICQKKISFLLKEGGVLLLNLSPEDC